MRKIIFMLLMLVSSVASAQAKEYRSSAYPNVAQTGGWHSSGTAACQADYAYRSTVDLYYNYNFNSYTDASPTSGYCRGTRCTKNGVTCSTDPNQAWGNTQNRTTLCVAPKVWDQPSQTCVDLPACPEGTKRYILYPTPEACKPIPEDSCTVDSSGDPQPFHNYYDGSINVCVANCTSDQEMLSSGLCVPKAVCPPLTYRTSLPGETLTCSPRNPDAPKTCPPDQLTKGFDGAGNAICGPIPTPPDPCPSGTRNISSDPANPNCAARTPDDAPVTTPKTQTETKTASTNTTNPDGSTTSSETETVIYPDGSKGVTTTTTTTHADGSVTKNTTSTGTGGQSGTGKTGGSPGGDSPTGVEGDLYQKKDKTFVSVLESFNSTVNNAPFINSAKSFLSVQVNAGACPSWTVTIDYFARSFDVGQYFCAPGVSTMFDIASIALLIAAAYVAFRMAFL